MRGLLGLLRWISWRRTARQPGRTAVAVFGAALGVAVFVGIRLASNSAAESLRQSVDAATGRSNLQVLSNRSGLDESEVYKLSRTAGVQEVWPVLSALVSVPGHPEQGVLLMGLDLYTDQRLRQSAAPGALSVIDLAYFVLGSDAIAVTKGSAEKFGWRKGDRIELSHGGRLASFTIRALLENEGLAKAYGGDVVVADIATAQEKLERVGKLDAIDLVVDRKQLPEVKKAAQETFPEAVVQRPAARGAQVDKMIESFRVNLLALSLVALFVGGLTALGNLSLSVIARRREISIARAVGASRGQIAGMFLVESVVYGAIGVVIGEFLGTALARWTLTSISAAASVNFGTPKTSEVVLDASTLALGAAMGLFAAALSGLIPALEAASVAPGMGAREGSAVSRRRGIVIWLTLLAVVAALAGWALAKAALATGIGKLGFASAGGLLAASALAAPAATLLMARAAGPIVRLVAGADGMMAARWVVRSLERTAVVIAALGAAVTMMVALEIMVGSFRESVSSWVRQTVRADVIIQPRSSLATGVPSNLPGDVLSSLKSISGVADVDGMRRTSVTADGTSTDVFAFDFVVTARRSSLIFVGDRSPGRLGGIVREGQIVVSEKFAARTGKGEGDSVTFITPNGKTTLEIGAVFVDYTSDNGLIAIHRPQYARVFKDPIIDSAAAYLDPGAQEQKVRHEIEESFAGRYDLAVMSNRAIYERVMAIFDENLATTHALKVVAVIVAVLGVFTTMVTLIMQRRREIGVLLAVGASRAQIARTCMIESVLLGCFGVAIGLVWGPVVSQVLIHVINKLYFGWTIVPLAKFEWFAEAAAWVIGASVAAGLIPAAMAARVTPGLAVRDEM